jgi:chromosome segregation ATPase
MDPKESAAKIQELTNQVATLTAQVQTVSAERDQARGDVTKLGEDIKKKDVLIEQKNQDIIGIRKAAGLEKKKLAEMTEAEKAALSEKEIELQQRQEQLEADQAKRDEEQKTWREQVAAENKKQVDARRTSVFGKMAGKNPEILKKLEENWSKLDKELTNKATTEEEISTLAQDAYNMLGSIKPEAVRQVVQKSGAGEAGEDAGNAEDAAVVKGLSEALGVPIDAPAQK